MKYSGLLSDLPHVKKRKEEKKTTWIWTSLQIYPISSEEIQMTG